MTISTSRPRRAGHLPISYRDDSTTDDESTSPPARSTGSQRVNRSRRRQSSCDDDSDDFDEVQATNTKRSRAQVSLANASQSTRSSRRPRNVTNYNEDSDAEYGEVKSELTQHPAPAPAPAPKPSTDQRKRPRAPPKKGPSTSFNSFKRRKIHHHNSNKTVKQSTAAALTIPEGEIPPWQTLPYQILLSILQYASYPFYRDASHDTGSIGWLTRVSTLSKSFHDAAIATILYSPPLFPSDRAHGLQELLDAPQETLSTSYQSKIKRLDIEVRNLLIKKSGIDLVELIKRTPLLHALHLYHNYDRVGAVGWAQPAASTGRSWSYPSELFEALDERKIRLKSWSWNGRFPDTKLVLDRMRFAQRCDCLKGLTTLSLWNLAAPSKVKEDEQGLSEDSLTTALKTLPDLQELTVQNCSIINDRVLASLPSNLRRLSLINCGNFNSAHLRVYLANHGYELEELILNGNQALNLGFAESLEILCPHLKLFKMDLTYSDPTAFHDVDPHYEAVFPDGNVPTWPRNLQTIDVENLRNLDAQDAENFLRSLILVAPELKDLRKLCIRILLQDEGWRERAKLRQTWMPKLEDVFLRQATPPTPFIPPALRPPPFPTTTPSSRPSTSHSTSSSSFTTDHSTAATPNKRKSVRIAKKELDGLAIEAFERAKSSRRSKVRVDDVDLETDGLRQGMCSEVVLHIDGQRPADEQFKEADFLDDELSGDEDWNGKDVEASSSRSRYAW
jgi:hypothetical protein